MIQHLQSLDYVAVGIYLLLMAFVGVLFGYLVKDSGSYFKGGGAIPWVMASITNFMGLFSTFVFVAYAGIAYEHGLVSITIFWVFVPSCLIAAAFLAKRWRRVGKTSPMEYLEMRYNGKVRQAMSWMGLVMRFLDNMVRLYAIGIFIAAVTPLSLDWSIIVSGFIVTTFNLFGGMWSVSLMSTIQFVIMILVTCVLLPLSLGEAGGLQNMAEKMPQNMTWFNGPKGAPLWLSVYCIMTMIKQNENWTFIQKFYCVRDEKAAVNSALLTAALFLVFTPVFMLPAVAGPVIIPGIDNPEMSYVALSVKLLPVGIMGIMFSSMFAATMSSLNAEYNVMSGVITHDIYKRLFRPGSTDSELLRVARWSTLAIGVIMTAGALLINGNTAFEANKLFTGIMAIPLGIPLVLGIVARRPDSSAALRTIFGGIAIGITVNLIPSLKWEIGTAIEMVLILLLYFLPSLRKTPVSEKQQVDSFFHQLDTPIPEDQKPVITASYTRVIYSIFIFSFVVAGLLFCLMSIPSISALGGRYSFAAGVFCIVGAVIMAIIKKLKRI
ncbi:MAG: sodium transporter [Bacteroidales bacterium]|nr:sodium transporter [Bacteroidales bacterium]